MENRTWRDSLILKIASAVFTLVSITLILWGAPFFLSDGSEGEWAKTNYTYLDFKTKKDVTISSEHIVLKSEYIVDKKWSTLSVTFKILNSSDSTVVFYPHQYAIQWDQPRSADISFWPKNAFNQDVELGPFEESEEITVVYRIKNAKFKDEDSSFLYDFAYGILKWGFQPSTNMKFKIKLNPTRGVEG